MERISTVARDSGFRKVRGRWVWLVLSLTLAAAPLPSQADPATKTRPSQRPSRIAKQRQQNKTESAAEPEVSADDGFGQEPPSQPAQEAAADELPENVHPDHPLVPALKMAYASRRTMSQVRDYTAQFVKKELVDGRYITHNMDMKFREQPFSVYLRFRDQNEGRQVLFVQGANGGQLLVKETGLKALAGTIRLNPTDSLALSENRHPITEAGIAKMLGGVIRQWEEEGQYGLIDVKYFPNAKLGNFPVKVIRTTHPERRRQFKFHMTQLYLDEKSLFPVRVEQFDWPRNAGDQPILVEQYMYSSVRANQNLGAKDFDPRAYGL